MRFLFFVLSIFIGSLVIHQFLPWFAVMVAGGLAALWFRWGALPSFGAGFAAAFILWGGYAGWLNSANGGLMAGRMGTLFGGLAPLALVVITGLLGGLLGGLGALTGSLGRQWLLREK